MEINTKPYEKYIKSIRIDDREQDRVEYALNIYSKLNPIKSHLNYGDYIFESNEGELVAFEFKTGSDFLTSMNSESNHLHNQVYELMTNFEYRFVIIQCEDLRKELNKLYYSTGIDISFAQINGFIADINRVATVVTVQTQYQAFDYMFRQAGKIFRDEAYKWAFGKKTSNSALNYLSSMKGLDKKAEIICKTLDLHCKDDLDALTIDDLTSVDGIGKIKAKNILIQLHGKDYLEKQTVVSNRKTTKKIQ